MFSFLNRVQEFLIFYANEALLIVFWAFLLSIVSMLVYKFFSPQERLKKLKKEQQLIQEKMKDEELMEEQAVPMAKKLLVVSSKRLSLTFFPALLSGLPILLMWGFLSFHFDRQAPKVGEKVAVYLYPKNAAVSLGEQEVSPDEEGKGIIAWPEKKELGVKDQSGLLAFTLHANQPEYFINQWRWWNLFIPSPYGYISKESHLNALWMELPIKEYLPFGPWWVRSWFAIFVLAMFLFSITIKTVLKIE